MQGLPLDVIFNPILVEIIENENQWDTINPNLFENIHTLTTWTNNITYRYFKAWVMVGQSRSLAIVYGLQISINRPKFFLYIGRTQTIHFGWVAILNQWVVA